jgi:hypothetical protein
MFNGRSFNAAMKNRQSKLEGTVYGGKIDELGQLVGDKSRQYPRTIANLTKWVLDNTGGPLQPSELAATNALYQAGPGSNTATAGIPAPPLVIQRPGAGPQENANAQADFCSPKNTLYYRPAVHYY